MAVTEVTTAIGQVGHENSAYFVVYTQTHPDGGWVEPPSLVFFAVAAAAVATGRQVNITYESHQSNTDPGLGNWFNGVSKVELA